jgi:hypothetical protein
LGQLGIDGRMAASNEDAPDIGRREHVERAAPPPEPAMAEPLDNRQVCEASRDVQTRLARLEGMRRLRGLAGAHGDPARRRGISRRVFELERVRAGLARAVHRARKLGRPRIDAKIGQRMRAALVKGDGGILKIAADLGIGSGTVRRVKAGPARMALGLYVAAPDTVGRGSILTGPVAAPGIYNDHALRR